jgi:hypothetical protein
MMKASSILFVAFFAAAAATAVQAQCGDCQPGVEAGEHKQPVDEIFFVSVSP